MLRRLLGLESEYAIGVTPRDGPDAPSNLDVYAAIRESIEAELCTRPGEGSLQQIFVENGGVVSTIFQTTQDALSDPDLVLNGHVVEFPGGKKLIGPVARMTETPAEITDDVPL